MFLYRLLHSQVDHTCSDWYSKAMVRPVDAARRAELLDQTIHYATQHGIAALSLRPLAAALGTSSRMLVHYFGTKEQLIGQALAAARPDIPALLATHADAGHTPAQMAERLWRELTTSGELESRTRLLLEVMALALTQPSQYRQHAVDAIRAWLAPLSDALHAAGHPARDAQTRATLLVSGLRGLALDRYLTGDRRRTDDAAHHLIHTSTEPFTASEPRAEAVDDARHAEQPPQNVGRVPQ
jgi:AcrR family transcriptional regulator